MNLHNLMLSPERLQRYPFLSLVSPLGGVVKSATTLRSRELHIPRFHSVIAGTGFLSLAYSHIADLAGNTKGHAELTGCGADESLDMALLRSVAEAAERYATCVYDKRDVRIATFNDMAIQGIRAEDIPRCSDEEYANPRCFIRPIDEQAPLRWVAGYSLTRRETCWVPLMMTHLFARPWPSEHFWLPISTGVAAHVDLAQAAVSAICEVIERDAIALTWLLQMEHPAVVTDDAIPQEHAEKVRRLRNSCLENRVFNATLDTGVPTLYSVQLRAGSERAAQFVNCSTHFDPWVSYGKLIRESAVGRTILEHNLPIPDDIQDFIELEHGAIFMGRREHRSAFDFLLSPEKRGVGETQTLTALARGMPSDPALQLRYLTNHFTKLGMDIVMVDMTTDELRDAGLHVVRAVIPGLMPMSACHTARYLGHTRLHNVKRELEARTGNLRTINPYPQPFA
ncbi:hypothetical protein HGT70_14225 [Rosenbergiella collisarenosi]|uniref:YcaO-like family protein n=1 Tax=Rosenbergiella collisarenosi TaxID=1544695 RepID=UPI001BDAE3DA|nr:YcaO-like family protein [Rosenbergiella collisarenosi]MBT0722431.1 hypothetical protein [Rosenbergiella collisarenosi]